MICSVTASTECMAWTVGPGGSPHNGLARRA
jgi:hypothetical protein